MNAVTWGCSTHVAVQRYIAPSLCAVFCSSLYFCFCIVLYASPCVCVSVPIHPSTSVACSQIAGGASFSLHSLESAGVGALLALPLAAFRVYSWSKDAYAKLPALEDMHRYMYEDTAPWLSGLETPHVALLVALETVPMLMLMLPAAQGGLAGALGWCNTAIQQMWGSSIPDHVAAVLALLTTAIIVGAAKSVELTVSDEEYIVVKNAVGNADRWVGD